MRPSEFRRRTATICDGAAAATTDIPSPTTSDELAGGIATLRAGVDPAANRLQRLRPSAGQQEHFADLVEHVDELIFQFRVLEDAAGQEAEVSAEQLAVAQQALDEIDDDATALDVPACGSASWGRPYVEVASAFVATQLRMPTPGTGDFLTDASAACGRFYATFASIPPNSPAPSDPAEYAAFLQMLEDAYDQLVVDLRALTPPPGSQADYDEVVKLIQLAAKSVDRASRDPRRLAELERPLGAIGAELGPRVRVLGFNC